MDIYPLFLCEINTNKNTHHNIGESFYEASCVSNLDFNLGWVPSMDEAESRIQIEVPFYMY